MGRLIKRQFVTSSVVGNSLIKAEVSRMYISVHVCNDHRFVVDHPIYD